jgi:hypothetical protein
LQAKGLATISFTRLFLKHNSAGAYSVDTHVHRSSLKTLARAAVRDLHPFTSGSCSYYFTSGQIAESDYSQPIFSAEDGNEDWAAFVSAIPECASTANSSDTFSCLQQVNTTSLREAISAGDRFQPVMDGPGGLIPNWPSQVPILSDIPLLIGTNKDEGLIFPALTSDISLPTFTKGHFKRLPMLTPAT